jgi:hypothetical protein
MSSRSFWRNEADKIRNDRSAVDTSELFANPWEEEDVKRPKWVSVYSGYPKTASGFDDKDTDAVFKEILGDNYDKTTFTNACATRVSLGLLEGGMLLRKDFVIQQGKHRGKGFIASAKKLQVWLSASSVWGTPDEIIIKPSTLSEVQNRINGRNGVYLIIGGFSGGISGHATLWIGSSNDVVGRHNYIGNGGSVYFWELK